MEKYKDKSLQELNNLFFELGNKHLVPELTEQIIIALEKFKELQADDEDLSEMIIVADVDERLFAFATGDGSDLEDKESESVFFIAQSDEFNDCMELLKFISYPNNPENHLRLDREVYHWIGDAMPDIDDDLSITIYGGYDYCETDVDPFFES